MMMDGYAGQCSNAMCVETVFLPAARNRRLSGSEPYSGAGKWPLLFACPECRLGSVLQMDDFHIGKRDLSGSALSFLEFDCSVSKCGLPVRVHTTASFDAKPAVVTTAICIALAAFHCPLGHRLSLPIVGDPIPKLAWPFSGQLQRSDSSCQCRTP